MGLKLQRLGLLEDTCEAEAEQCYGSTTLVGLFGHLLTREGSSTAAATIPQACEAADAGLTKPHNTEESLSLTHGCSVSKFPEGLLRQRQVITFLCMYDLTVLLCWHAMILSFSIFVSEIIFIIFFPTRQSGKNVVK